MTSADAVLAGLDDDQRVAATALHGPVAIIAGAGSGKTRVITHRIAHGVLSGEHDAATSVAVTFTTKAAGEMTRRLRQLGVPDVRVRTFHAASLRQLRYYWPRHMGSDLPEVMSVKAPVVGAAASALRLPTDKPTLRDLASEIEWAKVNSIPPQGYAEAALAAARPQVAGLPVERTGDLFAEYERRKGAAGRIDFEDVLLLMVALLESEPRVAAHVRAGLRHITVDEYQDASPLQQRLLDGWLGSNTNLCVVGDPAQTIYSFAGADATLLTGFAERYRGATVVRLPRTYRCTPEIAEAANRVLARSREGVTLASQRESGPAVRVVEFPHVAAEAAGVADEIRALVDAGTPPHEIAILVRMNSMTEPFEEALAGAGIGYRVAGGTGFFHRPEVRKAITLIRGAAVAGQEETNVAAAVAALLSGMGWSQEPPTGSGATRDAWESLDTLRAAAQRFGDEHPTGSLADFAADLRERAEAQDAPDGAGVVLASLHSAKGQEWRVVFLVGLTEGVLPHSSSTTDDEIAEERRLLYVGITRAQRSLFLTHATARNEGGRPRRPSRFLAEIGGAEAGARSGSRTAPAARRTRRQAVSCRVCGRALTTGAERALMRCGQCPGDADLAMLERLRQWRASVVDRLSADREGRVPAYIVANDSTLVAIAEQPPADLDALAEVPGIGPRKIDEYGEEILAVVRGD